MKILVWQWGRRGAGPRFGACLAAALRGRPGIEVALSLCRDAEIMRAPDPPVCEMPVRTYRSLRGFLLRIVTAPLALVPLIAQVRRIRPDLAICAMPGPLDTLMAAALLLVGVRIIVVVHEAEAHPGDGFPGQMLLQRLLCRMAHGVAFLSTHVGAQLAQQGFRRLIRFEHPPFDFGVPRVERAEAKHAGLCNRLPHSDRPGCSDNGALSTTNHAASQIMSIPNGTSGAGDASCGCAGLRALRGERSFVPAYTGRDCADDDFSALPAAGHRPPRLLCFGRLLPYKGLDLLADALGQVSGIDVRIAGCGPESEALAALRATAGVTVENRWVAEDEIGGLLTWCDAVVLPYREASQSGVAAAAVAAGRSVIATAVGGLREQLSGVPNAILCEPDAARLAAALRLWSDTPPVILPAADTAAAWRVAVSGLLSAIHSTLPAASAISAASAMDRPTRQSPPSPLVR